MEKIVGTLSEHVEKICQRRQELQNDEDLLKGVIDNLNLHCRSSRCDQTTGWPGKEEIMKAYQKAREDRDEYQFQLVACKTKIKELKEELGAARLNQTQHNSSVLDLSHIERKSCAYTYKLEPNDINNKNNIRGELNTIHTVSEEMLKREYNYLHKTNEELYIKVGKLESDLKSHDQLLAKAKMYEEEITILRETIEEKKAKIMLMRVEFDEQCKNSKRDFTYQISNLNTKIRELEVLRDTGKIDLEAAHEEIRLLKLSLQKPVKKAAEHSISIEFPDKVVTKSEQMNGIADKETLNEKEVLLNVNMRREKRGKLQSIENITKHQNSAYTSLSEQLLTEELQVEGKDLGPAVTKRSRRAQKGSKGIKKEPPASQKREAKKIKSSEEKSKDTLSNTESELTDTSSLNTRKTTRRAAAVNPKRKVKDCSKDGTVTNNKQNKKLMVELETDENVEPSSFESSSHSFINASGNIVLAASTPVRKPSKKVDVENNTKRRRNK